MLLKFERLNSDAKIGGRQFRPNILETPKKPNDSRSGQTINIQSHSAPMVTWKEVCELMARAGSCYRSSLVFPLRTFSQFFRVPLPPASVKVSGQRNVNNRKSEALIFFLLQRHTILMLISDITV